jgi:hypothetical protein
LFNILLPYGCWLLGVGGWRLVMALSAWSRLSKFVWQS